MMSGAMPFVEPVPPGAPMMPGASGLVGMLTTAAGGGGGPGSGNNTNNGTCSSTAMWFGEAKALHLAYVAIGSATLSFFGALFIVVTYLALPGLWQRKRVYGMRLVMYLSVANMGEAACALASNAVQVWLVGSGRPCGFDFWNCHFVAWFVEFFGVAALMWVANIGTFFFFTFIRPLRLGGQATGTRVGLGGRQGRGSNGTLDEPGSGGSGGAVRSSSSSSSSTAWTVRSGGSSTSGDGGGGGGAAAEGAGGSGGGRPHELRRRTEVAFHVLGWGLPLALTAVGVGLDIYGPAGDVCWIDSSNYLHQFFLDGLFAVLSLLWNTYVILRSVCIIKRQRARMTAENGIVLRMMYWYILVFVTSHLFTFGYRAWEYYIRNVDSNKDHSFTLALLQSIFSSVQGLGFAVMYGANKSVWTAYGQRCKLAKRSSSSVGSVGGHGPCNWCPSRCCRVCGCSTGSDSSFDMDFNTNSDLSQGGDDSMVGYVGASDSGTFNSNDPALYHQQQQHNHHHHHYNHHHHFQHGGRPGSGVSSPSDVAAGRLVSGEFAGLADELAAARTVQPGHGTPGQYMQLLDPVREEQFSDGEGAD